LLDFIEKNKVLTFVLCKCRKEPARKIFHFLLYAWSDTDGREIVNGVHSGVNGKADSSDEPKVVPGVERDDDRFARLGIMPYANLSARSQNRSMGDTVAQLLSNKSGSRVLYVRNVVWADGEELFRIGLVSQKKRKKKR
jgi:hypothetical protein